MSAPLPDLPATQILTPLTYLQFRAKAVAILQSFGLQPQNWAVGGIASSTLTAICALLAMLSSELSGALAQNFNPTASGGGLRMLSKYFYGFTPPSGTFASGQITIKNTGLSLISKAAGAVVFGSTVANAQGVYPTYTNDLAISLAAGASATINVTCSFLGSGGNSPPGFVTQVITSVLGLTCTNAAPIAGTDAPSDAQLQQQNLDSLGARSVFGPRSAFDYAIETATNPVTGKPVNINKWTDPIPTHTNALRIYVASPTGTVDPNDVIGVALCMEDGTGSTDPNFEGARPSNVTVGPATVTVSGNTLGAPGTASVVTYAPGLITLYVQAPKGTQGAAVQAACLTALDTFFLSPDNPIGGITVANDTSTSFTGVTESGITGVLATAVAALPGCVQLSARFAASGDLPLVGYQLAANGINAATLQVVLLNVKGAA